MQKFAAWFYLVQYCCIVISMIEQDKNKKERDALGSFEASQIICQIFAIG